MTPEEFTLSIRARVHRDLPGYIEHVRDTILQGDDLKPDRLAAFVRDLGGVLAHRGAVAASRTSQINDLVLAIFRSRTIQHYMDGVAQDLAAESQLRPIMERMALAPQDVPEGERVLLIRRILEDDRFVTGPIRVVLEDPGVRVAAGLPADFDVGGYLISFRRAIQQARSYEELVDATSVGHFRPLALAYVAVVVVVDVAGLVHTTAVAAHYVGVYVAALAVAMVNTVVTAAGAPYTVWDDATVRPDNGPFRSECVNDSICTAWLVTRDGAGWKRVALPPGKTSSGLGLPAIEAILIGGRFNDVQALETERDGLCRTGAYVLSNDPESPGVVTLRSDGATVVACPNAAQRESEKAGRAGFSDLAGGGSASANYDPRFRMAGVAAAAPEGFDFAGMIAAAHGAAFYNQALRLAGLVEELKRSVLRADNTEL